MHLKDILGVAASAPFNVFDAALPERMVIFGAGGRGRRCRERLLRLGVSVPFFADNDPAKHGTTLDGALILAPAELLEKAPDCPVLVCSWGEGAIVEQLKGLGVGPIYVDGVGDREESQQAEEHAEELGAVLALLADQASCLAYRAALRMRLHGTRMVYPSPYPLYGHPLVSARKGDVIVDGGAAEGDTLLRFMEDCQGDCALHLFEPTPASFAMLRSFIASQGVAGATAVNKALWSSDTTLRFKESFACAHSNHVSETGGCEVSAIRLDTYAEEIGLPRVDLIKLDIEGAELEALKGAAGVIRRHKPRLQICLYHNLRDFWEIPLYLKSLVPEYRLFVGHHACTLLDTVLYCVA